MVQEELALHQVEWEVMECPSKNHSTDLVIETLEDRVVIILEASLPSQNCKALEDSEDCDGKGRAPPDDRVANEVDLTVVLAPEVDTTLKNRPRWRAGVPSVRFDETSICLPHNLLQFPEFTEEAGVSVIDLLGVLTKLRVLILLNVPNTVGEGSALCAGNFLLFGSPVGKLNLVGEQDTASHHVYKSELGLNSSETLLGGLTVRHLLDDLDAEVVIGIALETFVTICRHLILPFSLTDRWADIVRMETAVSGEMVKFDSITILDESRGVLCIPCVGTVDWLPRDIEWLGHVL